MGRARVVDQHRYRPARADLRDLVDAGIGGEICDHTPRRFGQRCCQFGEPILAAAGHDQVEPLSGEAVGKGSTDSRARAGGPSDAFRCDR